MLWNDLRYTARTLRRSPVFTAAAILTLALGIGANTAIFSVVNAVLLRPLPFAQPERLIRVAEKNDRLNLPDFSSSVPNYLSWKEQSQTFEQLGALGGISFNMTGRGEPRQFNGSTISPSLLPLLGLRPVRGRGFQEGEDKPGSAPVVMVSEALVRHEFAGDANVIGRNLTLNGTDYQVVGIAPAALGVLTGGDLWVPMTITGNEQRLNHVITSIGRLKPGVSVETAQAEMNTISHRLGEQYPEVKEWGIHLVTFHDTFVSSQLQTVLLVLLGAVVVVLLIACANVANLLLSRAAGRQREIAVRIAMGASAGRLLRQLLTESVVLSVAGGGAGLLAAVWAVRMMDRPVVISLLPVPSVGIDQTVLLFAVAMTLATGLLFGLAPAWHVSRTDLNTVLKQGGRSSSGGARPFLRKALVAGELALATMLLIGAGMLLKSLLRLEQVRLGFQPDRLLTFQLALPPAKYPPGAKSAAFYRDLMASLSTLPGVRGAAASSGIPFGNGNYTVTPMVPVGKSVLPPETPVPLDWRMVTPGYFQTMQIPLLRGRTFTEQDIATAPRVMVVSQSTATKFWGSDDPLGRMIRTVGSGQEFTVVGVVGDARNTALSRDPGPATYMSGAARVLPVMDVVVRTDGKPEAALAGVRQRLHELDKELPLSTVRTMEEWLDNSSAQPRMNTTLLAVFAGIALLIAAIGIYGVLAYSVNQRTREIGLRMAIGAQRSNVLRLVVQEGMTVALGGIAAGLAGAAAAARVLASLLYGVPARDPATYATAAMLLSTIALIACALPAWRASRVDPMVALRDE